MSKKTQTKKRSIKRRNNTKKRSIKRLVIPESQSVPIFTGAQNKQTNKILVNDHPKYGNFIPGLRNYLRMNQ